MEWGQPLRRASEENKYFIMMGIILGLTYILVCESWQWNSIVKLRMTPILPLAWITWCCFSFSWANLFVSLKQSLWELERPQRKSPPFKGEHLEHAHTSQLAHMYPKKYIGSQVVGSHGYPCFDLVNHNGKVHPKSYDRKVNHPSIT